MSMLYNGHKRMASYQWPNVEQWKCCALNICVVVEWNFHGMLHDRQYEHLQTFGSFGWRLTVQITIKRRSQPIWLMFTRPFNQLIRNGCTISHCDQSVNVSFVSRVFLNAFCDLCSRPSCAYTHNQPRVPSIVFDLAPCWTKNCLELDVRISTVQSEGTLTVKAERNLLLRPFFVSLFIIPRCYVTCTMMISFCLCCLYVLFLISVEKMCLVVDVLLHFVYFLISSSFRSLIKWNAIEATKWMVWLTYVGN